MSDERTGVPVSVAWILLGALAAALLLTALMRGWPGGPGPRLDEGAAGRASALDELEAFLDGQAADDATWDCFPRLVGARDAVISREPYGPELAARLPVRCSTAIRPTEFQVWEVTLRIDWGLAPGDRIGHWQATLYGGRGQGWNVSTESDRFPGSTSGDAPGG